MDTTDLTKLTGRLTTNWLFGPLLRLLAGGQPVTVRQLADATGRTPDDVEDALDEHPDTEHDPEGRIVGQGLTLNPTPYRFRTRGRTLYTWCALDTLIFPAILDAPAVVESSCHATGAPIRLTVDPTGGVSGVEPSGTVVSLVTPDGKVPVRTGFCNQVRFFASAHTAGPWLDAHPGATAVPVDEAHALARRLARDLATPAGAQDCCRPGRGDTAVGVANATNEGHHRS
ncbi:organomercurial lyase MerB [Micrococcaceae bacterium Sec5.7]